MRKHVEDECSNLALAYKFAKETNNTKTCPLDI